MCFWTREILLPRLSFATKLDAVHLVCLCCASGLAFLAPSPPVRNLRVRRLHALCIVCNLCRGRIQAVVATMGGFDSSSPKASAGVFQPRVLRGRALSSAATKAK